MQFTSAVFALLAIGANAAVIERQDPQVTNFRTFSQTGCSAGNEGVSSIEQSDLPSDGSGCLSFVTAFHGNTEPVESIIIGGVASGCSGKSTARPQFNGTSLTRVTQLPSTVILAAAMMPLRLLWDNARAGLASGSHSRSTVKMAAWIVGRAESWRHRLY